MTITDGGMIRRSDRWTDGQTGGQMDRAFYRVADLQLKNKVGYTVTLVPCRWTGAVVRLIKYLSVGAVVMVKRLENAT